MFDVVHSQLGWPSPEDVLHPKGVGAEMYRQLASEKLGKTIARLPGGRGVRVGVLSADPNTSEAPLAVVCEFVRAVPIETLLEAQRLAWNFGRSLLLITIEPHLIRSWSCCETPVRSGVYVDQSTPLLAGLADRTPEILEPIQIDTNTGTLLGQEYDSLHWLELVSGRFFEKYAARFPQNQRADQMLLSNLKEVRNYLRGANLSDFYSHDLLARIIFIQFLFDRKDSSGHSALNPAKLVELHRNGVLSKSYDNFADLLSNYDDAYALFRWLNVRFNGDLFPAKTTDDEQAQEEAWRQEMEFIKPEHLKILSDFVRGDIELGSGQMSLWPQYAFDAIPLEFISSIYEEFVSKETGVGIHYTPDYLVDLMLDRVLPLGDDHWDLKVLDPACGSGIFLVKTYQRLIYRWKLANRGKEISPDVLRYILEHNLFGVDSDTNAVRVASFSLYLAMCDEIDPRHYWSDPNRVRFPSLRDVRIIQSDFFEENKSGIRSVEDAAMYDIVVGNPPWGDKTMTAAAKDWGNKHEWKVANNDFGVLFVAKSGQLAKHEGLICLVQSTGALLYNQENTALRLRRKVFLEFRKVENIINLGAFRLSAFQVFRKVKVPTCILIIQNVDPDGEAFLYESPKPLRTSEDINRIVIEMKDTHFLYPNEVISEPWIWSALTWGGSRDRDLLRRLSQYSTLEKLRENGTVKSREGVNWGDRKKLEQAILGRRYVGVSEFASNSTLRLSVNNLNIITTPYIDSRASSDFSSFTSPQLLLKTSWVQQTMRFQAKMIQDDAEGRGVICSQSFISVHADNEHQDLLEVCCACYNSSFATYYFFLTSGRFAFDRSELLTTEMRSLPIPAKITPNVLDNLSSPSDTDHRVYELFSLKESDRILIEDMIQYTLPDFKGKGSPPGYRSTRRFDSVRESRRAEPDLVRYGEVFRKVMQAAYGTDKYVGVVIYNEGDAERIPMRAIRIYLNSPDETSIRVENIQESQLRSNLAELHKLALRSKDDQLIYQRCIRTYDQTSTSGQTVLVISIVKPDQIRYWTRSMALRDADEVAADLMSWSLSVNDSEHQIEVIDG
jgi:type I restriction-modification system DNA methylase subunit